MSGPNVSAQPTDPLVQVQRLERRFGVVPALRGIDLAVRAAELILIVGPNGAGKSTLLRSIAGLVRPWRGSVRIAGRDLQADPAVRGLIGLVSHQSLLYEDLTARENLRFAAALHGIDDAGPRVMDALDTAGLAAVADRRTGTFSRGMIQRLAIARATLHAPVLLLFDEPFTGLDAPAADLLRRRMAAERDAGRAVVCVTHEPAEVWDAATRIVVLVAGKVVIDRPRPADLARFRGEYQELLRQ